MGWAQWPGRMHFLIAGPVTHLLPSDAEVWVDGGHNVSAGLALAKYFADYEAGSIDLVIGMLSNKDPAAIITPLREKLASVTVIPVPGHESHTLGDYPDADAPATEASDISAALRSLDMGSGKTILIAGSLYLAGEVLKLNEQVPD
jgi:dihydrofolate synthase/folylpolyglutamate synthase